MPEVTDLMRVAQWAKSSNAPSEIYNAACRLLDERVPGDLTARMTAAMRVALVTWSQGAQHEHLAKVALSIAEEHAVSQAAAVERLRAELAEERTKHQNEVTSLQRLADRCREKDWAHSAEQAKRREQAEAERDTLIDEVKTLQQDLDEFGEAEKRWLEYRRERDALKAAIERAQRLIREALTNGWDIAKLGQAVSVALNATETPEEARS